MSELILSEKDKTFLSVKGTNEYLEGTTASGKTTIGIFKWMLVVANNDKKFHIIAGADKGTAEKNIINAELGLLDQFQEVTKYNGNGTGNISIPHIEYKTAKGTKIIYVVGYDDKRRWTKVLGGQVGCVFIDEVNIADMEFVREASHRCDYMMTTNNPDDPKLPIYKEYINRSRPLKKYTKDYPSELLNELNEPYTKGWIHWYFTFKDNKSLSAEDIEKKKNALSVGTKMYKNKILGIRGKATGLVFNVEKRNIINEKQAIYVDWQEETPKIKRKFIKYSIGCDTSYSSKSHDKLTFEFVGITDDHKCILLEEESQNNKERTIPFAPSDVIPKLVAFAEKCKVKWGFARDIFIDSADAGTIAEAQKYKRKVGCIYNFVGAWKKTTNLTRVQLQQSWLKTMDFLIVDTCKEYLTECDTYSFTEDGKLEDGNDHNIQGCQYAWLPYKKIIGDWKLISQLIKDAYSEGSE